MSTAGWYWLYVMMLFSHLVVMLALIAESNRLYAAGLVDGRAGVGARNPPDVDRCDGGRHLHEVGQPLAAVGANAAAGWNWRTRPRPDAVKWRSSRCAAP